MYKLEPEIKLDRVLTVFKENYDLLSLKMADDVLKKKHADYITDFLELKTIFVKLINDGYLHSEKQNDVIRDVNIRAYIISFEGFTFLNSPGGYVGQVNKAIAEAARVDLLETKHTRLQKTLNVLTAVVAVGTVIAAWYYGIEIWKFYCQ